MIQIGARNMQNFSSSGREVGLPVLLKRDDATMKNPPRRGVRGQRETPVVLCERGIRTFTEHTRNTLDLSAVPAVKRLSHLPIVVDPSHGTGRREKVLPMALASVAAGADGLIIEVHHQPERALSDGHQAILPEAFESLMQRVRGLAPVMDREVHAPPVLARR
jgi:3-deoxy-7-phosphoheptulonate synthase